MPPLRMEKSVQLICIIGTIMMAGNSCKACKEQLLKCGILVISMGKSDLMGGIWLTMFKREIQKQAVATNAKKVSQKNQDCSCESPASVVRSSVDRVLQKRTDCVPMVPLKSA